MCFVLQRMIDVLERFDCGTETKASKDDALWVDYREFCYAYHSGEWRAAKLLGVARCITLHPWWNLR